MTITTSIANKGPEEKATGLKVDMHVVQAEPSFVSRLEALSGGKPVMPKYPPRYPEIEVDEQSLEAFAALATKMRATALFAHGRPVQDCVSFPFRYDLERVQYFTWFVERLVELAIRLDAGGPDATTIAFAHDLAARYPRHQQDRLWRENIGKPFLASKVGFNVASFVSKRVVYTFYEPMPANVTAFRRQLADDCPRIHAAYPGLLAVESALVDKAIADLRASQEFLALPSHDARLQHIKRVYGTSNTHAMRIEEGWFYSM